MEGERKPRLLYFTGENLDTQTFCSISNPTECDSTRIPEWGTLRLCTVQHGWYLWEKTLSKYVSSFILWNPLLPSPPSSQTHPKKIMLPPLKHNVPFIYFGIIALQYSTTNLEISNGLKCALMTRS